MIVRSEYILGELRRIAMKSVLILVELAAYFESEDDDDDDDHWWVHVAN